MYVHDKTCKFYIFSKIKKDLRKKKFTNDEEVRARNVVRAITKMKGFVTIKLIEIFDAAFIEFSFQVQWVIRTTTITLRS